MWISNSMIVMIIALSMQLQSAYTQTCSAEGLRACAPYTCVPTDTYYSCLCPDLQLVQTAAQCNAINPGTTPPPIIAPTACANAVCSAGSTCVQTCQNPPLYICVCPNGIIANPNCPINGLANNPCVNANPCLNGGTCVVNQLTLQAVCICPPNTYGPNCGNSCYTRCDPNWCYNGGRCANAYGLAYCSCPSNYRGRRCELRHSAYNYVYLYRYPNIGK